MKYFGILKGLNFLELDSEQQESILIDKGCYNRIPVLDLGSFQIQEKKPIFKLFNFFKRKNHQQDFTYKQIAVRNELANIRFELKLDEELLEHIYHFLLNQYDKAIDAYSLKYLSVFEEEKLIIVDKDEEQSLAKKHYNKIISPIILNSNVSLQTTAHSPVLVKKNDFEVLQGLRENLKENLNKKREIAINYLLGDLNYFDGYLINENDFIKSLVKFEAELKVVVYLNHKYMFHDNNSFISITKLDFPYEVFKDRLFVNSNPLEYINYFLKKEKELNKAKLNCLFEALLNTKLIENKKVLFKDLLNDFFMLPFKIQEVRIASSTANISDADRIKEYEEKIKNFITLKP